MSGRRPAARRRREGRSSDSAYRSAADVSSPRLHAGKTGDEMANVTSPTNGQERRPAARGGNGPGGQAPEQFDPRMLVRALTAFRRGDFSVRLPDDWIGVGGKIADAFNDVVDLNQRMAREPDPLRRVGANQ